VRGSALDFMPSNRILPRCRSDQTGDRVDQRRLASAFGPMIPNLPPASKSKETSDSALTPPNLTLRSRIERRDI